MATEQASASLTDQGLREILNLKNVGPVDLRFQWNNQKFLVRAGQTLPIYMEAIVTWFGDPNSSNSDGDPARATEHRRIAMKYGAFNGSDHTFTPFPEVEVWNTDGRRIWTPMEDPEGELMFGTSPTEVVSGTDEAVRILVDRHAKLEAELVALRAMVAERGVMGAGTMAGGEEDVVAAVGAALSAGEDYLHVRAGGAGDDDDDDDDDAPIGGKKPAGGKPVVAVPTSVEGPVGVDKPRRGGGASS